MSDCKAKQYLACEGQRGVQQHGGLLTCHSQPCNADPIAASLLLQSSCRLGKGEGLVPCTHTACVMCQQHSTTLHKSKAETSRMLECIHNIYNNQFEVTFLYMRSPALLRSAAVATPQSMPHAVSMLQNSLQQFRRSQRSAEDTSAAYHNMRTASV